MKALGFFDFFLPSSLSPAVCFDHLGELLQLLLRALVTLAAVHGDRLNDSGLGAVTATTSGYGLALGVAAVLFVLAAALAVIALR